MHSNLLNFTISSNLEKGRKNSCLIELRNPLARLISRTEVVFETLDKEIIRQGEN